MRYSADVASAFPWVVTGIHALDWLVTYLGVMHLKGELSVQNKSNWVLG